MLDDAVSVVQARHRPDHRTTGREDEPMAAHAALVRNVRQVLRVMQQRDRVTVRPQAQHLPAAPHQPVEWGTPPVVVVPRHVRHPRRRIPAAGGESPFRVVGRHRPRHRAEHLGEHPAFRIGRRLEVVEGRRIDQERSARGLGPLVDPRVVVAHTDHHQQGPLSTHGRVEGGHQAGGTIGHRADGAHRCVQHQRVAGHHPQPKEILDDVVHRERFALTGHALHCFASRGVSRR